MITKKWFLTVFGVSAALAITAAYLTRGAFPQQALPGEARSNAETGPRPPIHLVQVADASLGFGPTLEARLPGLGSDCSTEILNLASGRCLPVPRLEQFNGEPVALVHWIRTNGLNISGQIWSGGPAACVTYNLTLVPLDTKSWDTSVAQEIPSLPFACASQHSPRRLLVLGNNRPEVYAFRTDEGTVGMLRLVGVSDDRQEVIIRYKLVQAPEEAAAKLAAK